jgi:small subunit ribosomal protein S8
MTLADPVADLLTRLRNGYRAGHEVVEIPHSGLKSDMLKVMKREGFVTDYSVEGGAKKVIRAFLKYNEEGEPAMAGVKRESKPGLRSYAKSDGVPSVLGGLGVVIVSTSSGVMTGSEARKQGVGGEVLCSVW